MSLMNAMDDSILLMHWDVGRLPNPATLAQRIVLTLSTN